jgi:hypothetical protein
VGWGRWSNLKYSVIHLYLYGRIKKEILKDLSTTTAFENRECDVINISRINPIIKWVVRLPSKYQKEIIRELIECGFLKRLGRDKYKIMKLENISPLSDSCGEPLW